MRTKCAISDAFVRECVIAYCASVAQYVYSLSAEHCFRPRNNAISDERVRDCALVRIVCSDLYSAVSWRRRQFREDFTSVVMSYGYKVMQTLLKTCVDCFR